MSALAWTTEKPKVAGVYWYRQSLGLRRIIVEVEFQGGTLTVIGENAECSGEVAKIEANGRGRWSRRSNYGNDVGEPDEVVYVGRSAWI
jgi:hypothetical protein